MVILYQKIIFLNFTFYFKQRFLILNEFIKNENKRITGGIVLSGPHGVGKSYISYLIATYINFYP